MAKRTSSTTRNPSVPKVASRKSDTKKLGEALGEEMQREAQRPGMTPQASTPMDMANEVREVTHSMIAERAYQIWKEQGGSADDNWMRAERELRDQNIVAT